LATIASKQIKAWAKALGFNLVGIAAAEPIAADRQKAYERYLAQGYYGEMRYLARNVEKRVDPRELVPGAKSVICTATNYYVGDEPPGKEEGQSHGRVARYAWGRDYHIVLKERLKTLADKIRAAEPDAFVRRFVDTAPVAEREFAMRAGLGWIGKNGLVLNKRLGSWLLLGEIVTDLELDYDEPGTDHCGSCTACLDACPTGAFDGPQVLDPRKCISYLTIESRKPVPDPLAKDCGDWIFGCDVCQEVCPFNRRGPIADDSDFQPRPQWATLPLQEVAEFTEEDFQQRFTGNAMERTNCQHMQHVAENCRKNTDA
jgi:epoxyqueuosine reductase